MSLTFAAIFIALRVFYRLLFGSLSWLAVGQAINAALPFAALIVFTGLLTSLINVSKLLVSLSALKYSRSVGTALSIALASFPTLLSQVRQINQARVMRGIRSRMTVVVPVLEHTVEKSVALAAALELKGFGATQPPHSFPVAVSFNNYSLGFGNRTVLQVLNLDIEPGTITVLTGPTGSGKTSVLESIAGLSQHFHNGHSSGSLTLGNLDRRAVPPRQTAHLIGFVPQNVRLSFTASTAREELTFSLRLHGISSADITSRVTDLLEDFRIDAFADVPLDNISSGQATRLAIATAMCASPSILLLDEPLADLDSDAVAEIVHLLVSLREAGVLIVLAEHHTAPLDACAPTWLTVCSGEVLPGKWDNAEATIPPRSLQVVGSDQVLSVSLLTVTQADTTLAQNVSFSANTGDLVAITGANGVGKSSLLSELSRPSVPGTVLVSSTDIFTLKPVQRVSHIAHVPEDVASLFTRDSLAEELSYADSLAGIPASTGLTSLTLRSLLGWGDDISSELLHTHPRDLSAGTQLALAISLQLSWKPSVITIDEPTRGLDPHARHFLAEVLRCVAETGTVVIFATHDVEFARSVQARHFVFRDAILTEASGVRA